MTGDILDNVLSKLNAKLSKDGRKVLCLYRKCWLDHLISVTSTVILLLLSYLLTLHLYCNHWILALSNLLKFTIVHY
uniref:Uncharacterized protein n=1 Tax=Amphimedon queenslandica TaxID=400682 RepID=A0A1X7V9S5_AMPQE